MHQFLTRFDDPAADLQRHRLDLGPIGGLETQGDIFLLRLNDQWHHRDTRRQSVDLQNDLFLHARSAVRGHLDRGRLAAFNGHCVRGETQFKLGFAGGEDPHAIRKPGAATVWQPVAHSYPINAIGWSLKTQPRISLAIGLVVILGQDLLLCIHNLEDRIQRRSQARRPHFKVELVTLLRFEQPFIDFTGVLNPAIQCGRKDHACCHGPRVGLQDFREVPHFQRNCIAHGRGGFDAIVVIQCGCCGQFDCRPGVRQIGPGQLKRHFGVSPSAQWIDRINERTGRDRQAIDIVLQPAELDVVNLDGVLSRGCRGESQHGF